MPRPTKEKQAENAAALYKTQYTCWRMREPELAEALKGKALTSIPVRAAVAQWLRCDPEGTAVIIRAWHSTVVASTIKRQRKVKPLHKRARLQKTREEKAKSAKTRVKKKK